MRVLLANYFDETDRPHDINAPGITNGIASSRARFDELLGINSSDLTPDEIKDLQPDVYRLMADAIPERQWIKVHDGQTRLRDGRWLFAPEVSGGVVYLIRHPCDVAVSMAFHDGHGNIDQAVAKLCNPDAVLAGPNKTQLPQTIGSWGEHVLSWVDQGEIPVLVVRYEDMLGDPLAKLSEVLAFARPDDDVDQDRLSLAVENSKFERLSAAEDETGFREKPQKAARFFRKGLSGDWQNQLTSNQVEKIYEAHNEVMLRFGYSVDGTTS